MDEPVAVVVQVDPLGGDIGAEQEAYRAGRVAEVLDHALLVHVAHAAVEDGELAGGECEVFAQPEEGFDALGEDDQPVAGVAGIPGERLAAANRPEQRPVLAVALRPDAFEDGAQHAQGLDLRRRRVVRGRGGRPPVRAGGRAVRGDGAVRGRDARTVRGRSHRAVGGAITGWFETPAGRCV